MYSRYFCSDTAPSWTATEGRFVLPRDPIPRYLSMLRSPRPSCIGLLIEEVKEAVSSPGPREQDPCQHIPAECTSPTLPTRDKAIRCLTEISSSSYLATTGFELQDGQSDSDSKWKPDRHIYDFLAPNGVMCLGLQRGQGSYGDCDFTVLSLMSNKPRQSTKAIDPSVDSSTHDPYRLTLACCLKLVVYENAASMVEALDRQLD